MNSGWRSYRKGWEGAERRSVDGRVDSVILPVDVEEVLYRPLSKEKARSKKLFLNIPKFIKL